ncbi:aspartate kinase [Marinibaculum pumilum]|uniref:Aspartokinase n=1 Tax=Marinibaculum pumilum TaxID=1766165 RepID=A0ABV7KTK1_9PROT
MACLVVKFGGTSVGSVERIRKSAEKVARELKAGHQVAVVVSAMAGETNRLVDLCQQVAPMHDAREYDAVVATGEQVSAGLFAMTLQAAGIHARSWQGWQLPLRTDRAHGAARILEIETGLLRERMAEGQVPVITGFQGLAPDNRTATLGRGGSDTSAVAVAAALNADRCDIYTDVDGVYTADPRIVPAARRLEKVTYEEMLELASLGAKVLQTRSVELAMKYQVPLQVLSSMQEDAVGSDLPGTMVVDEDEGMEEQVVSGVTYDTNAAKITLVRVSDRPGVAAGIFVPLADAGINVDMIVQSVSDDGKATDLTFTVPRADLARATEILQKLSGEIGFARLLPASDVVKISVVGVGMRSHAGVAASMFRTLAEKGINIQAITTSEIKVSVLVPQDYTELAVRSLHQAFGLDATT